MNTPEPRYRRLLWAYPKGPRCDELLGTLIEGGGRPTLTDAVNLARCGVRARLGRPASRSVVVVALLAALCAGFFGAAIAGRLAWNAAPPMPAGAELAEITGTVFPAAGAEPGEMPRERFTGWDIDYTFTTYRFGPAGTSSSLPGDQRTWIAETARRMTAAGWTVRGTYPLDGDSTRLWVDRGDLSLVIDAATGADPGLVDPAAHLEQYQPGFVTAAAWLAFLPCALLGWLLTGWAARRSDHAEKGVRRMISGLTGGALFFLVPLSVAGLSGLVGAAQHREYLAGPFWSLSITIGLTGTVFGLLLAVAALLLASDRKRSAVAPVR